MGFLETFLDLLFSDEAVVVARPILIVTLVDLM